MYKHVRFLLLVILAATVSLKAQEKSDLEKALGGLLKDAGSAYVAPVVSAFGANLNSGWVHRAPQAKLFGFDLEVGFVAMGTMFKDENKTFDINADFQFNTAEATALVNNTPGSSGWNTTIKNEVIKQITQRKYNTRVYGPTILGKKDQFISVVFPGDKFNVGGTDYVVSGKTEKTTVNGVLDEVSALPLAAPQLTFGTIYGTSVSFRFLPSVKVSDELGDFKYFGFGIQHNPSAWLPYSLPVDVSLGFFTQTMDVGDLFQSKATTFGVFASKKFGPGLINITPYAGFAVESSTIDVAYDLNIETPAGTNTERISFSLEGENTTRFTIGASIKVLLVNLNVDYSLAKYNVASAGLSFYF